MMNRQKEIAKLLLEGVVTDQVQKAYDLYTLPNFKHHNGFFKGDRQSLLDAMIESNVMYPNKKVTIILEIAEPPYVTLYSQVQIDHETKIAVVHIFRFEGEKVAEMWDISQKVPKDCLNENGMF